MKYNLLAGGYDKEGFAMLRMEDGKLTLDRKIPAVNPSYMLLEEGNQRLYTVEETREGHAASWKKEGDGFVMDGVYPTFGSAPCHVFRSGNVLLLANYGSGSLARCTIGQDGALNGTLPLIQHGEGSHAIESRQAGPHAHFTMAVPGGKYIAACDLGMDCVLFYETETIKREIPAFTAVRVPDGCGPRHAAFLSHDEIWYVACELSSDILVYRGYADQARLLQKISMSSNEKNAPAAIRISPDEKYVIVSNRGDDRIAVFAVHEDGTVEEAGSIETDCEQPRDAAFSPDGKYLAVACQKGSRLIIFRFDGGKGEKTDEFAIDSVSSVLWY